MSITEYLTLWSRDYSRDVQVWSKFIFRKIPNFQSSKLATEEQKLREKNIKQRKVTCQFELAFGTSGKHGLVYLDTGPIGVTTQHS